MCVYVYTKAEVLVVEVVVSNVAVVIVIVIVVTVPALTDIKSLSGSA